MGNLNAMTDMDKWASDLAGDIHEASKADPKTRMVTDMEAKAREIAHGIELDPGRKRELLFKALTEAHLGGMEEAAKVNEALAEKIKHTSHADGLGMGSQCCENRLKEGAAAIREKGTDE